MTDDRAIDRAIGSVVGLAIGDALGAPVEGWSARRISEQFGTLMHYADTGRLPGAYTDDTQQALCITDVLLQQGGFDPDGLATKFVKLAEPLAKPVEGVAGPYFGAFRGSGPGFRDSVLRLRRGVSWRESGTLSAGNGTAMRVAPLGAFYYGRRFAEFRSAVFQSAWITHTDPRALSAAFMIAYSVIHAVNQGDDFHPESYLHEVHDVVRDAEKIIERRYWSPDLGIARSTCYHVSGAIERVRAWLRLDVRAAIRSISKYAQQRTELRTNALSAFVLGSGTVAVYLFARHFDDPEDAIVATVNLGGDADTIGAMVGALVGALHGHSALPTHWREGLRNHDAIYARAEALSRGGGMPEGAPNLREMEVALTLEEAAR